jgi:hypothetical protein
MCVHLRSTAAIKFFWAFSGPTHGNSSDGGYSREVLFGLAAAHPDKEVIGRR